jgi:mRNA interferase MazF
LIKLVKENERMERDNREIRRGEVYWAKIPKLEDSKIQAGVRPVIITSNEMAAKHSPVIQYIPVTTQTQKCRLPVHVILRTNIFPQPSLALVEQEGCIDKNRLMEKIGTLSEEDMLNIDRAIIKQRGISFDDLLTIARNMKQYSYA